MHLLCIRRSPLSLPLAGFDWPATGVDAALVADGSVVSPPRLTAAVAAAATTATLAFTTRSPCPHLRTAKPRDLSLSGELGGH